MGVSGDPIRAEGIGQARIVIMLVLRRLRQSAAVRRVRQPGEPQWQKHLAEERHNPDPGCRAAPDARMRHRLAPPTEAMDAEHLI